MQSSKKFCMLIFFSFLLVLAARSQSETCQNPQYIIPFDPIDEAFDTGINYIRGQNQLVNLIQNPNESTLKDYIISLAPFAAPLFAMAAVTLIVFIATIVQVICFNSCSKQCCGNEITSDTYNICCFRTMVISFIVLSFFVMAISIAALIVSSDLQKAIGFTNCNTQNIVYQTYEGNNNQSIPWSGSNNFQADVDLFAVSVNNNIPFLLSYFSSSNDMYNSITNTSAGSPYSNSQVFQCQNSNNPINCPFPSNVQTCTTPYEAVFNSQFCNTTFNGSAAYLVSQEMSKNSTVWRTSTVNISASLTNLNVNTQSIQDLITTVNDFTNSLGTYQSSILQGTQAIQDNQDKVQIALYVFYSVILGMSLLAIISLCMPYFCNVFKCRYFMYFFWYMFFLLAFLLFIASGFFLSSTIFTYDTCVAYPYYFNNQTNFNDLNFTNNQIGSIFNTCFYGPKGASIFNAFTNTSILMQFGSLYSQYQSAVPNNQFSTVVTTIENKLLNYASNPNTVTIQNVGINEQPQTALNQMNLFANWSLPNTTQSCKLTKDYFTYDVVNCGMFYTNQPSGNNSCQVIYSSDINNIVSSRVADFNSRGCVSDGATYQSKVDALLSYGSSVSSIALSLAPVQQSNTPLQNYQTAYFTYYSDVMNFYNVNAQQLLNNIFTPYLSLQQGSSCGFVTSSMNGIVNVACNVLQPYINSLSALNIICSAFVFILFLLAYFLTTRLEFYEFLQGNFSNFGVKTITTKSLQDTYDLQSANSRNVQLLVVGNNNL